jgi:hypothetical protein
MVSSAAGCAGLAPTNATLPVTCVQTKWENWYVWIVRWPAMLAIAVTSVQCKRQHRDHCRFPRTRLQSRFADLAGATTFNLKDPVRPGR